MAKTSHTYNRRQEIEYYIDANKRTIVAKLPDLPQEIRDTLDIIARKGRDNKSELISVSTKFYIVDSLHLPQSITAKAVCSEADEWNVPIGMEIARERLLEKVEKWRAKAIRALLVRLEVEREVCMKYMERYATVDCGRGEDEV